MSCPFCAVVGRKELSWAIEPCRVQRTVTVNGLVHSHTQPTRDALASDIHVLVRVDDQVALDANLAREGRGDDRVRGGRAAAGIRHGPGQWPTLH